MSENTKHTLIAALAILTLAGVGAYLVRFDRECGARGGKTVRGLFGLECVTRLGE